MYIGEIVEQLEIMVAKPESQNIGELINLVLEVAKQQEQTQSTLAQIKAKVTGKPRGFLDPADMF